jgi:hypothetical protein
MNLTQGDEPKQQAQPPLLPMGPMTPKSPHPLQSPVQAPPATENIAQPHPEPRRGCRFVNST